jgi:hypothetical protein
MAMKSDDGRPIVDTREVVGSSANPLIKDQFIDNMVRFLRAVVVRVLDYPEDFYKTATVDKPVDLNKVFEQLLALKMRAESIEFAFNLLSKVQNHGKKDQSGPSHGNRN